MAGGVSSWVHQLIKGLDDYTFSLAVILPSDSDKWQPKYDVPENVKDIRKIFLHDLDLPSGEKGKPTEENWQDLEQFHTCPFSSEKHDYLESIFKKFINPATRVFSPDKLLDSKPAWEILRKLYDERAGDESFLDYFWTYKFMHSPLLKILTSELPSASVYHTVSTGYAGLLAVVGKLRYNRPVILTEHGIYTRERRFDISRADWIYEKDDYKMRIHHSQSRFKELWNKMFVVLSQLCYAYSNEIITLFEGNREYQIKDGAAEDKIALIPNAIDFEGFHKLKEERESSPGLVIGFVGRVVSIKDVKTFIRACKKVASDVPNFKAYIIGPTDEEEDYYKDCVKLVEFLGLASTIEFTGKVDVKKFYTKIDILVLTSISEAQPLVILEANSLGVPVVATDVGACSELLYGRAGADKALGKSGLIANITNSDEIGECILKIWQSKDLRDGMSEAGQKRVERYYNHPNLLRSYRDIYDKWIEGTED